MAYPTTLETCRKYLYTDEDKIPDTFREKVLRIRDAYTHWYCFPAKSRKDIAAHITERHHVDIRQAYYDVEIIQILLGNVSEPSKAWLRFRLNSILEEELEKAQKVNDFKAVALIADKIGKYNNLDKPDAERMPFDQIVPQPFEPTDDPTPLGIAKDPDIRRKKQKMLDKYISEIEIIDVPYEEMLTDAREEEDIL